MSNKLKPSDSYQEAVRFTQAQVQAFADCSGDNNPLHLDAEYAAQTRFGKPIVHGFFAAAVFSKIFGTTWPGEGTIYMYQDMSFKAPVFVENDYEAKCTIVEVNEEKHRARIQCLLTDAEGKVIIEGEAKIKHTERF